MPSIYNRPIFKDRRRELRTKSTRHEQLFWYRVRNNQLGYRFFRQYSAGPYILDFYCPKLRLAVEIDGGYHSERDTMEYDKEREIYLSGLDIKTIRFKNKDVMNNIEKVIEQIRNSFPLETRGTKGGL